MAKLGNSILYLRLRTTTKCASSEYEYTYVNKNLFCDSEHVQFIQLLRLCPSLAHVSITVSLQFYKIL
jgi:hypothetical protein